MTASIVEALLRVDDVEQKVERPLGVSQDQPRRLEVLQPSLADPLVGKPISHNQIISLSLQLKEEQMDAYRLESLLRGSAVYVPPPPPKPEQTSEYKALMARLRAQEESRKYERMTTAYPQRDSFGQPFSSGGSLNPTSASAYSYSRADPSSRPRPFSTSAPAAAAADDDEADEVAYADVNRQVVLIFNVLLSVLACAAAVWRVARWWGTPARLALSMAGGLLVGVAEVVVYAGYMRRVGEAKGREKAKREVREVVRTWVVGGGDGDGEDDDGAGVLSGPVSVAKREVVEASDDGVRRRGKRL